MANAVTLLEQDHREVERLFRRFEERPTLGVARQICRELRIHLRLEEEIVYPELRRIDPAYTRAAERDHGLAAELIQRAEALDEAGPELHSVIQQLRGAIEHHVEEESAALPMLERSAGQVLNRLGKELEMLRRQLVDIRPEEGPTKDELYEQARQLEIPGRSTMTKEELAEALSQRQ